MGKAERCLHKHTWRTWLSACDHFGHTIWQHWHYGCSLCGISDHLYTLKVKVKNKWIYRTQKSLQASANWAPRFKRHFWKQLVLRSVEGCCPFHLAAAGSGDTWTFDKYENRGIHATACCTRTYIIPYPWTLMEVNFSPMSLLKIEYHIHVSIPQVEQPHMISHGRGVNKVGPPWHHKGRISES